MNPIPSGLLNQYLEKTGKSPEEAEKLIREKTAKFAGLLTEEAALFLLAKEAGINPDLATKTIQPVPIQQLEPGQTNIDVLCVAKHVYPIKEFPNKNKPGTGKRGSLLVCDETGEIYLTLWHQHTDLIKTVSIGTPILLSNVSVTEYNGQKQLNFGFKSGFDANPTAVSTHTLPNFKTETMAIEKIEGGQYNLNVSGTITKLFPVKSFENDRDSGEYRAFEIKDDSAIIRCVAWNDAATQTEKLKEGDAVLIENAYSKTNRNDETELHLGDKSRVVSQSQTRGESTS
ncbi:MAG: hypothetical protein J4215_01690 [Candidatus Diapherotrites archaeon]|uniref:OB domain-containing protein n=1 Tax=Candidatus Iainarchaeum sp. TaxID=3101447 RepID=A0A8T4LD74_9ARCH|nr:hypothetical protein [Candidatus Diapherotrites archaeon]